MADEDTVLSSLRELYKLMQEFHDPETIEEEHIALKGFIVRNQARQPSFVVRSPHHPIARLYVMTRIDCETTKLEINDEFIQNAPKLFGVALQLGLLGNGHFELLRAVLMGGTLTDFTWDDGMNKGAS